MCGDWDPGGDAKLDALLTLITRKHPSEKVLVFTQFADTVDYLEGDSKAQGLKAARRRHRRFRRSHSYRLAIQPGQQREAR